MGKAQEAFLKWPLLSEMDVEYVDTTEKVNCHERFRHRVYQVIIQLICCVWFLGDLRATLSRDARSINRTFAITGAPFSQSGGRARLLSRRHATDCFSSVAIGRVSS